MKKLFIVIACSVCSLVVRGQILPYLNPQLSAEERARDLVSRLTLEEKANLMCDESEAIPRLGIKSFSWWSEALHGVANQGNVTVFPEPIGMAASFDDELVYHVFDAVSDEMRAKYNERMQKGEDNYRFHHLSVWTPNVNIFRDPRWGRGQETYGEDPYLTTQMGIAVVKGLQGSEDAKYRKLLACAKHYAIHSGPEWSRHTANVNDLDPRDLWETYMPAFKALVQKAGVREVMCAYQRWDDEPCCGNNRLLHDILRYDWGFKYLVVSDCGAIADFWTTHKTSSDAMHSAVKGTIAGTDVECGFGYAYKELPEAVRHNLITEEEINEHVMRVIMGRIELGEFDDPQVVSWSKIPVSVLNCEKHKQLSLEMSRKSMVLLRNTNNILPLKKSIKKIAVIGPNADDQSLMWGNYNGTPNHTVTILDGIKSKLNPDQIIYMKCCDLVDDKITESLIEHCAIDGQQGIKGTFWNNQEREGVAVSTIQTIQPINVTTYGQHTFAPGVNLTKFSGKYETIFKAEKSEEIVFRMKSCGSFELLVNGESLRKERTWRTTDTRTPFVVEEGKEYKIEVLYTQVEDWAANMKFNIGREKLVDYAGNIAKLKGADIVIFAGGISPQLEGEEMPVSLPGFKGGDRTDIELPLVQRNFLKALKSAGKHVIFINCSGSAIALLPETESCDAILQAWYAGEQGGNAISDVLFGDYNPSGKLPITFYKSTSQLPDYESYSMKGRTYRYMSDPLYPFGFGLSYTKFNIGAAKIDKTQMSIDETATLTIPISNVGKREGKEVVQVYVRKMDDEKGPLKSLKAYQCVNLAAGKSQQVKIELTPESFETYDVSSYSMKTMKGEYEILYGTSSDDKDLKKLKVTLL